VASRLPRIARGYPDSGKVGAIVRLPDPKRVVRARTRGGSSPTQSHPEMGASGAVGRGVIVSQDAGGKVELNPSTPIRATGETRCAAPCPGERAVDDV